VSFIDKAFRPQLVANEVIKVLNVDTTGTGSFKVPRDAGLLTAQTINTDGTVPSEETTSFDATDESIEWHGLYTLIPTQLVEKSNTDLLAHRFEQLGEAIGRKLDSDVITELNKASTAGDAFYGTNNNETQLGSSTDIDIQDVFEAQGAMLDNDANPTDILMNGTNYAKLQTSSGDVIRPVQFMSEDGVVQTVSGIARPNGEGTMRVHVSSQVPDNTTFLVDRNKLGYVGDAGDIVTFDARVNETVQREVGAYKPYGVRISQPQAVYQINDNTAP